MGSNEQISEPHQASRVVQAQVQAQGQKADAPEQAQEPVVDTAEDARHDGSASDGGLGL